jgi:hypothetical protein
MQKLGADCIQKAVQNLLSSRLLSKHFTIKIYRTVIYLFLWVWNLVPYTKGRTQIKSVWEQGAEQNI